MEIEKESPAPGDGNGADVANEMSNQSRDDSLSSTRKRKQKNSISDADWKLVQKAPTLVAYVQRVGAEFKSFRRAVIEEHAGGEYHRDTATIRVDAEGTVTWIGNVEGPSEAEVKAIQKEVSTAGWPVPAKASKHSLPNALMKEPSESIFQFLTLDGEHVTFIQHRFEPEGKPKVCTPWSFWSDGEWRQMEPDGPLPLFGLEQLKDYQDVFIHEGPKAAREVRRMVAQETRAARDAFNAHPWSKDLIYNGHLGWAGGAPNPHRTDWSVLRKAGVKNIIVVADNDQPGQEAVKKISRMTLLPMAAVMFDNRFKTGFDLADPWPDEHSDPPQADWWRTFEKKKRKYIGPTFHEMCIPATWATRKEKAKEAGRPKTVLRDEFVAEWIVSADPHLFAHRRYPHVLLNPKAFNTKVAPFSEGADVASLLVQHPYAQADGICYRPFRLGAETPRIITIDGERKINTYRPPSIKPVRGNAMPFLRYMTHLIPDKRNRFLLMRWCATLIARPEVRMTYSVLLVSETQGVGKTTLSDAILAPLVGPWNVSYPTEKKIVDGGFNAWIDRKRLGSINEIYSGERRKAYDNLKAPISDKTIDVNRKHQDEYTIENFFHAVACSNSIQAIHLDGEDRRWLVPGVTEKTRPDNWWITLFNWLNGGGLPIIAGYFEDFVQKHGAVKPVDRPPITDRKHEVINVSRTDGAQMAYDLARAISSGNVEMGTWRGNEIVDRKPLGQVVLRMDEVRAWVAARRGLPIDSNKLEKVGTLLKAMVAGGMKRPLPKATDKGPEHRVTIGIAKIEVVANFQIEEGLRWSSRKGQKDGLEELHWKPEAFVEVEM